MASRSLTVLVALLSVAAALAGCVGQDAPGGDGGDPPVLNTCEEMRSCDGAWLAAFSFSPEAPRPGDPVSFRDDTPPNGGPNSGWQWDFGGGATSTERSPTHAFEAEGEFTVRLTIRSFQGTESSATRTVVVSASNPPPPPPGNDSEPADGGNGTTPPPAVALGERAVVAVIDSGINPYHEWFSAPERSDPKARIPGFPEGALDFPLTRTSDYAASVKADEARWKAVGEDQLIAFTGSRVVAAISMGGLGSGFDQPFSRIILDEIGHGTGTAGAVAMAGPNVDIVMVQVGSASLAEGIRWAAAQPWIDVVSVSWGATGNVPAELLFPDVVDATRAAHDAGKLVIVSAGNEPTFGHTDGVSGPTWVIPVGGVDPETRGEILTASKGAEVVSDYSPVLPTVDSVKATAEMYGTSFAAPLVTGALAETLTRARALGLTVGAADLRAALHQEAVYWGPLDYQVPGYVSTAQPIPIGPAPWMQMGWGYAEGSLVPALLDALQGKGAGSKDAAAAAYMDAQMAARAALWG